MLKRDDVFEGDRKQVVVVPQNSFLAAGYETDV
jgi:hypothetical protein